MPDIAIKVQNLSKRYRIGLEEEIHDTFAGALTDFVTSPIRNFRRLRRLSRFEDNVQRSNAQDIIWALRDVSFEVQRGEVVGIIGRNGAGKSTLLKILSRITHPTSGRVELNGRVSSLLEVGTGFHQELTGRENIYLNGTILGMTKAEVDRKFDEIVDFSGVEKFIDTPVKRYSSGMRVRLAFSVAAHLEPEILLVDEVLAVGDAGFQKKCLGKMGEVASEGRTVLFVSHNMGIIQNLCSRAIFLNLGQLVVDAPVVETVGKYFEHNTMITGSVNLANMNRNKNNDFFFRSIEIHNTNKEITSQISLSEGFEILIRYETLNHFNNLNLSFALINGQGVPVFVSTETDRNPSLYERSRSPGVYSTRCYIPSELLRPGIYHIELGASIPKVQVIQKLPNAISLEVLDDGTSIRCKTSQGRKGVIAPLLKWHTSKI